MSMDMEPTRAAPLVVLAAVALLALAASAAAQDITASTHMEVPEPEAELGWDGSLLAVAMQVALCYEAGGFNPSGGAFTVQVAVDGVPEWVQASGPGNLTLTPPTGPTTEAGCQDAVPFDVELVAPEGVLPNTTFTVQVSLAASAEEDEGTGNFDAPADEAVSFDVTTVPASDPPPPPNGDDETEPTPTDDNGVEPTDDPEDEDSPGPAAVLLLLAVVGLAVLMRRR